MNHEMTDAFTMSVRSDKYIEYSKEFQCPKVLSRRLAVPGHVDPYYGTLTMDMECPTRRVSDGVDDLIIDHSARILCVDSSMHMVTHSYSMHVCVCCVCGPSMCVAMHT